MGEITSDSTHLRMTAQPISEHEWQVCTWRRRSIDDTQAVIGYISELGGTYEVRRILWPPTRNYVLTFKEAMECFGAPA